MADSQESSVGSGAIQLIEEDESPVNSSINTTPLVDIMLVLLIIFLITVPVAVGSVDVTLPEERNLVVQTRKENINLAVAADGSVYWNLNQISDQQLTNRLAVASSRKRPRKSRNKRGRA
ncbi:MAG: biopolymer transporter ExbD [Alphaproteobacteria bacterium]|nr:MAG: biopolymer transporter ExbD [Alphaproteobacteria bacterium]